MHPKEPCLPDEELISEDEATDESTETSDTLDMEDVDFLTESIGDLLEEVELLLNDFAKYLSPILHSSLSDKISTIMNLLEQSDPAKTTLASIFPL